MLWSERCLLVEVGSCEQWRRHPRSPTSSSLIFLSVSPPFCQAISLFYPETVCLLRHVNMAWGGSPNWGQTYTHMVAQLRPSFLFFFLFLNKIIPRAWFFFVGGEWVYLKLVRGLLAVSWLHIYTSAFFSLLNYAISAHVKMSILFLFSNQQPTFINRSLPG